ncbi:MAG: SDR family oxidoreductase [Lachnospiraceae bacterium]|nr:SDR family oxidoreductase [Lachnospiraceae bacterium]
MKLGITGVTGKLGSTLVEQLKDLGGNLVLLARNPQKASVPEGAEIRKAGYDSSEETIHALKDVDVLFMVSAKENANRLAEHKAFVDAAKAAGVRHIVYTSFYNAAEKAIFTLARDHYHTEEHIKSLGFTYTFIRDNFYMDFLMDLVLNYGEIKGPAGEGRVSAVVRSDVAEVLAVILRDPERYENRVLNMTGPEDLSIKEVCERAGKVLNKQIPYIEETVEEAYESRKQWEAEQWEYDSWVSTYTAIRDGEQKGVSSDIEEILGRTPKTLEDCLYEMLKKV